MAERTATHPTKETTMTNTITSTLASVTLVSSAEDGPTAIRITHTSVDPQTFWATPGVDAIVLGAAGLNPSEFKLAEGEMAHGTNGDVTEEVRLICTKETTMTKTSNTPEIVQVTLDGLSHDFYAAVPGDPDDEGYIHTLLFSRAAWRASEGPEAEIDDDGDAAFFSANGYYYKWGKITWAADASEAKAWFEAWAADKGD
jgi:hypothetical protein